MQWLSLSKPPLRVIAQHQIKLTKFAFLRDYLYYISMIKAIFFDVDGTLLSFKTHAIPQSTLDALTALRARGIKLFVATGRSPQHIGGIKEMFDFDGYITVNGQYCFNKAEIIYQNPIDEEDVRSIVSHIDKSDIVCNFVELDCNYYNRIDEKVRELNKIIGETSPEFTRVEDVSRALQNKIYQLSLFVDEDEEDDTVFRCLPNCRAVRWFRSFVDVIPANGGKSVGISNVLKHYGFSREESMAFGDGGNDIEMLEYAGVGVAMGNAKVEVQQIADYVTDHVDNDGIYKALVHYGII